jgi:hypothetical protein
MYSDDQVKRKEPCYRLSILNVSKLSKNVSIPFNANDANIRVGNNPYTNPSLSTILKFITIGLIGECFCFDPQLGHHQARQ